MIKRLPYLFLFLLLTAYFIVSGPLSATAQPQPPATEPLPTSFLPQSPTVAHLLRFDHQESVNLQTGAAQASIPLAELSSGQLKTSVSLAYSFSGLRVVQSPDLIGLGWTLQAGGTISRRVVGRLDEDASGYGRYDATQVSAHTTDPAFLKSALQGGADTAPDVYDFSVAGYHGRFLVRDTSVVLLPAQPVRIRRLPSGVGFELDAETGVRYEFAAQEVTTPHHQNFGNMGPYASAWQLTRIIAAGGTDTITFHYSKWSYRETTRVGQTSLQVLYSVGALAVDYLDQAPHNSIVYGSGISAQQLDSISIRGGRLLLQRDAQHVVQRLTLLSTLAGRRQVIRSQTLGHSFFAAPADGGAARLRLDWVQESQGGQRLPPYQFTYNSSQPLPSVRSLAQDHWGYYNGAANTADNGASALLPEPKLQGLSADRQPNADYAQAGGLLQITYPTGGTTTLAYESNRYALVNQQHIERVGTELDAFLSSTDHVDGARLLPTGNSGLAQLPGQSFTFTLTEPTTVGFFLLVRPYLPYDPNNSYYSNKRVDFLLLSPRATGDTILAQRKGQPEQTVAWEQNLPAGRYVAWVLSESLEKYGDTFAEDGNSLVVTLPHVVYKPDTCGNGVRVRQTVTRTPGAPALTTTYSYTQPGPLGPYSSGVMFGPLTDDGQPIYRSNLFMAPRTTANQGAKFYFAFTSDITRFGDEYSRCNFYYQRVTKRQGDASAPSGQTVYTYRHQPEQFNEVVPLGVATYRSQSTTTTSSLQLVQTERYQYGDYSEQETDFPAIRPYYEGQPPVSNPYVVNGPEQYNADPYTLTARFWAPNLTTTTRFGSAGDSTVTQSSVSYQQQRPVRTETRTSDGQRRINLVSYLSEYSSSLPGYAALRAYNFNPIVEVQHWAQAVGQPNLVLNAGEVTLYDSRWQQPASTWHLELDRPTSTLATPPRVNGRYSAWLSDPHYRRVATEYYEPSTGDPIGQVRASGPATTYQWGYQGTQLIAQAQLARPAQVACTSFEGEETGRWQGQRSAIATPGFTGQLSYDLAAGLSCQGLPAGQYKLSCYRRGPAAATSMSANGLALSVVGGMVNGWTAYEAILAVGAAGRIQLTGNGQVDEVRLAPIGARLTSYTYAPLVGMTSQTGPDGRTTFYEYDELGRLVRTRDEQGRILSQQQYHYAGQ